MDIRKRLWTLCFGDEAFDETSSLQDLYQTARTRHSKEVVRWLTSSLSVAPDSLPDLYLAFFGFPWHRCYTLNIDNLANAAQRRFQLPRELKPVSATSATVYGQKKRLPADVLEIIHLNGTLDDLPDNVTFSVSQYSERLSQEEPWYNQLIVDLLSRPVVFIGTQLDEPPMWQHIERRQSRGSKSEQQLRPKSYLITPTLSKARQACLSEFNITWIPLTAEEFYLQVLIPLRDKATTGHQFLRELSAPAFQGITHLPEVAELSVEPMKPTGFLSGAEPIWADIQSKRAVERDCDGDIARKVGELLKTSDVRGVVLITGTAGTGKSTSLKRLALKLSAAGSRVGWIDRNIDISPRLIKQFMSGPKPPNILAIDDADLYGAELSPLISEICLLPDHPLVLVAIRSGKVDRGLNPVQLGRIPQIEFVVPGLTDQDIGGLIDVLDRENRLGILVTLNRVQRIKTFQEKCGRQLLVAMIEATSGDSFHKKIVSELDQLDGDEAKNLYSSLEELLRMDFNFWLHRGCLELEGGNIPFAEVCLNYARGLNPDDLNTNTEYADLLFCKALAHPSGSDSSQFVELANKLLTTNIAIRGAKDPHSYHVLGKNMLEWIKRGIPAKAEKSKEVQRILKIVEEGAQRHPSNEHLKLLHSTLKDEYLALALIK